MCRMKSHTLRFRCQQPIENIGCMFESQYLANVGTFCVYAVRGYSATTIKLNALPNTLDQVKGSVEYQILQVAMMFKVKNAAWMPEGNIVKNVALVHLTA